MAPTWQQFPELCKHRQDGLEYSIYWYSPAILLYFTLQSCAAVRKEVWKLFRGPLAPTTTGCSLPIPTISTSYNTTPTIPQQSPMAANHTHGESYCGTHFSEGCPLLSLTRHGRPGKTRQVQEDPSNAGITMVSELV